MEQPLTEAANDRVLSLYHRMTLLANVSLGIVAVVLVFSLAFSVTIARGEQTLASDLREELECRSLAAGDFSIAQGNLSALIADGLVLAARDEPLDELVADLVVAADALKLAATDRRLAAEGCKVE